jgi:uncharacterized protein
MAKNAWLVVCLLAASLSWPGKALPQTAPPDALAAAKELMVASKMADQINTMLPVIMQQLKQLIAKGNALVERDFDAFMPVVMASMNTHLEAFLSASAQIYAQHFTADEIRQVTNFYRTPVGEKFLRKQPEILQQTFALRQQFGQAVGKDVQARMTEELRKRGHDI